MACLTVACYSWKGGTGRTTAACNIAASLSSQGYNVMTIDLDVEAPGLFQVLDIDEDDLCRYNVKDYLRIEAVPDSSDPERMLLAEPIDLEQLISVGPDGGIMDVGRYWADAGVRKIKGKLYMIPAKPGRIEVPFGKAEVHSKFRNLIKVLKANKDLALDFIIIDSASGLRGSSLVAMFPSDLIIVFLRWTIQHLRGTVSSVEWIENFRDSFDRFQADYILVASSVPDESDLDRLTEYEADYYRELLQESKRWLAEKVPGGKGTIGEDNTIREILPLKWREKVIVLDDDITGVDYQRVSGLVLKYKEDQGG